MAWRSFCGSFLLLLCVSATPFSPGNHSVEDFSLNPQLDRLHAHVWAPKEAGSYPTVAFATAFGLNTPSSTYRKLFTRLATHGVIVVAFNKLNNPNYPHLGYEFGDALDWMASNLTEAIAAKGLPAEADVQNRLVVSGHSAGNHIVARKLEDSCGLAKAFVMIDPVDGVDPWGHIKEFVIHPPQKVNFTIPALHIETGNDPVSSFKHLKKYPPCAPANMSNSRFYDAWRGPIWQVNATAYGHLDVCDDGFFKTIAAPVCKEEFDLDLDVYRNTVADLAATFIRGVFEGDTSNLKVLENPSGMPVDVLLQHDYHGNPAPRGGCTNS